MCAGVVYWGNAFGFYMFLYQLVIAVWFIEMILLALHWVAVDENKFESIASLNIKRNHNNNKS